MEMTEIPVLKEKSITIIGASAWYAIKNKGDENKALEEIAAFRVKNKHLKHDIAFDFKNETRIGTRSWSVINDEINVYQNTDPTMIDCMVSGKCTGFEKVFWFKGV